MNRIKYFQDKVLELSGKLKIKRPYIRQDNRLGGYIASICEGVHIKKGYKRYFLTYNAKVLNTFPKWMIIHSILHELGHIKTGIQGEYKAEKFALKAIKKHFPMYYQRTINYLKNYVGSGIKPYDKAFSKLIKELNV